MKIKKTQIKIDEKMENIKKILEKNQTESEKTKNKR